MARIVFGLAFCLVAVLRFADTAAALCGDAILEAPTEQCDDGNLEDDDCCSSVCTFDPAATPCRTDELCYGADAACDGSGSCVAAPVCTTYNQGFDSFKVDLHNPPNPRRSRVVWRRKRISQHSDLPAFGNPADQTRYAFCIYADSGTPNRVVYSAELPAGSDWRPIEGRGWRYKGSADAPGGVRSIKLRTKVADRGFGLAVVKARGEAFVAPVPSSSTRYFTDAPILALVTSDGYCVDTTAVDASINTAEHFHARVPLRD